MDIQSRSSACSVGLLSRWRSVVSGLNIQTLAGIEFGAQNQPFQFSAGLVQSQSDRHRQKYYKTCATSNTGFYQTNRMWTNCRVWWFATSIRSMILPGWFWNTTNSISNMKSAFKSQTHGKIDYRAEKLSPAARNSSIAPSTEIKETESAWWKFCFSRRNPFPVDHGHHLRTYQNLKALVCAMFTSSDFTTNRWIRRTSNP